VGFHATARAVLSQGVEDSYRRRSWWYGGLLCGEDGCQLGALADSSDSLCASGADC
jgi:hypothetical protein